MTEYATIAEAQRAAKKAGVASIVCLVDGKLTRVYKSGAWVRLKNDND